jgi:hypothetical protein
MGLCTVPLEVHHRAQVIDAGECLNPGIVVRESEPSFMPR